MKCYNLHCHKIEVYIFEYNKINKIPRKQIYEVSKYDLWLKAKNFKKLEPKEYIELPDNPSLDLYIIKCVDCNKIYEEYKSNFNFPNSTQGSLFCTKNALNKYNFNEFKCFQFVELNNFILIGTGNEINLYICEKFNFLENSMKQLSSNNENIRKYLEQIESEKSINKNLISKISELERIEKRQKIEIKELYKLIKEKERQIQILENNNKNLENNLNNNENIIRH